MNDPQEPLDSHAARKAFGDAARPTSPGDEGQGWVPHSAAEFGTDLAAAHPRYRVIEYMKHGGMGAVYRCTDSEKGGREVVVKVMRWDRMHAKDFVARFRRERDMLSKLEHPHIVPCLDMGETADGYPFFVMPYLTGVLLEHYTRDRPPLPRGQARAFCIRILQELCAALGDLHENGGIHRDVKPSNIFLVGREESVRLLDLGILRLLDPTDGIHTMLGDRPGTQRYLAPEVMANRPADERADIYSLGVIALQLLTGHYPEPGYAKPSEFGHDPRFDAIIEKALNPYPADRYESAKKFAEALEAIKELAAADNPCPGNDARKHPVIQVEDYKLTINGYDFTFFATIEQLIEAVGKYSRVEEVDGSESYAGLLYQWDNFGFSAFVITQYAKRRIVNRFRVITRRVSNQDWVCQDDNSRFLFPKQRPENLFEGKIALNGVDLLASEASLSLSGIRPSNWVKDERLNFQSKVIESFVTPVVTELPSVASTKAFGSLVAEHTVSNIPTGKNGILETHFNEKNDSVLINLDILQNSEGRVCAITFASICPIKNNSSLFGSQGIDVGSCLGNFLRYNSSDFDRLTGHLATDEQILLAAPGEGFRDIHYSGIIHLSPIFILTNKCVYGRKTIDDGWQSMKFTDYPEIGDIYKLRQGVDAIEEAIKEGDSSLQTWLTKRLLEFFDRSSVSSYCLSVTIHSQKKTRMKFRSSFLFYQSDPSDELEYEFFKEQIEYLFKFAKRIASDPLRRFASCPGFFSQDNSDLSGRNSVNLSLHPDSTCSNSGHQLRAPKRGKWIWRIAAALVFGAVVFCGLQAAKNQNASEQSERSKIQEDDFHKLALPQNDSNQKSLPIAMLPKPQGYYYFKLGDDSVNGFSMWFGPEGNGQLQAANASLLTFSWTIDGNIVTTKLTNLKNEEVVDSYEFNDNGLTMVGSMGLFVLTKKK